MRRHVLKAMFGSLTALVLLIPIAATRESEVTDLGQARMAVETKSAFENGDTLAFRVAGRAPIKTPAPSRIAVDLDVRSLATGESVGTMTWDLTCLGAVPFPCGHYDLEATFRLPGGTLVNRSKANAVTDPGHPDSLLIGIHPDGKTIEGTGVFAGRTGKVHQSGFHICRECPNFVTFDDFWLIELDRV